METIKNRLGDKAIPIIIAIIAVIVVGIIAAVVYKKQDIVETQRTARVIEVNGPCSILREGATINAIADMPLYSGDTFFSGVNASARIMIDDDKFLYLDATTRINFTASGTPDDTHTMIYVETGSMFTEVKEKLAEGETFDIVTPNTSTAIYGTMDFTQVIQNWDNTTTTIKGCIEGQTSTKVFEKGQDGVVYGNIMNLLAGNSGSFTTGNDRLVEQQNLIDIVLKDLSADAVRAAKLENLATRVATGQIDPELAAACIAAMEKNNRDYFAVQHLDPSSTVYVNEQDSAEKARQVTESLANGGQLPEGVVETPPSSEPVSDADPSVQPAPPSTEPSTETEDVPSQGPSETPSTPPSAAPAPTRAPVDNMINGMTVEEQIQAIESAQAEVSQRLAEASAAAEAERLAQEAASASAAAQNYNHNNGGGGGGGSHTEPSYSPEPEPEPEPAPEVPAEEPAEESEPSASVSEKPSEKPSDEPSASVSPTPSVSPSPSSDPEGTPITDDVVEPVGDLHYVGYTADEHSVYMDTEGNLFVFTPDEIPMPYSGEYIDSTDEPIVTESTR